MISMTTSEFGVHHDIRPKPKAAHPARLYVTISGQCQKCEKSQHGQDMPKHCLVLWNISFLFPFRLIVQVWFASKKSQLSYFSEGLTPPTRQSGWWFGTFSIFPYIGNNHPNWLYNIFQGDWNHQPEIFCWFQWSFQVLSDGAMEQFNLAQIRRREFRSHLGTRNDWNTCPWNTKKGSEETFLAAAIVDLNSLKWCLVKDPQALRSPIAKSFGNWRDDDVMACLSATWTFLGLP